MLYINNTLVNNDSFPDGTALMKVDMRSIDGKTVVIKWLYDNDSEMARLMFLVKHLKEHGYDDIILVMPYIPNARYDRVKTNDEVFTLKYFAEFINSLKFSRVYTLDPHSYVSEALIDGIVVIPPTRYLDLVINKEVPVDVMLYFPDEGAMKRYSSVATDRQLEYVFGIKRRDWKTGQILGLELSGPVDKIAGRDILIIDDICSRGGTFYYSAKALKVSGANNISLYVSHCEDTIKDGELLKPDSLIKNIYTTNSIYRGNNPRIKVYDCDIDKLYEGD